MDLRARMPDDVARNAGYLLSRVGLRARRQFAAAIAELGIRPPHFGILVVLDEHGAIAQSELAEAVALDPGQLVGLLDELERDGLISRARDAADRRRHAVTLTAAGRKRAADGRAAATRVEHELLAPLDATERDALRGLLVRLASR